LSNLFKGNNLYPGAFALFLVLLAFCSADTRRSKIFRLWGVMTLIALLLALGQWSPLYVILVKLTHFYSFRIPAKFLGFFCFGIAMMSATGFQALWQGKATQDVVKKAFYAYLSVLAIFVAVVVAVELFFTAGRDVAMKLGRSFVMRFIYAHPGHPHSLDTYLSGVTSCMDSSLKCLSVSDPANLMSIVASGLCVALLVLFLEKKVLTRSLLVAGVIFLVADLYAASYLDIKLEFATYQKALAPTPALQILKSERSAGRLGRIYGFRSPDQRLPLTPSQNMLYGIEDIGAYSPLVSQRYYQTIGLFGNINDSNFAVTPTPAFVLQRLPVLSFLNVSHILSAGKLTSPDLSLVFKDAGTGVYLYSINRKHWETYFISAVKIEENWGNLKADFLKEGFDPAKTLLIEKSAFPWKNHSGLTTPVKNPEGTAFIHSVIREPGHLAWDISVAGNGFFVSSDLYDLGWKATVNGKPATILPAFGLFRAVEIENPGTYRIEMEYRP
jgi:hypothetical protein